MSQTNTGINNNNKTLFVGNLSFSCSVIDLQKHFEAFGDIKHCELKQGFGFVTFEDQTDATRAQHFLDGSSLKTHNIKVDFATPKH